MNIKDLKKENYEYSWGGAGFSLLFQSLFAKSLQKMPFYESFYLLRENKLYVFWLKDAIVGASKYGYEKVGSVKKAKDQAKAIERLIERAKEYSKLEDIDEKRFLEAVEVLREFLYEYIVLDPEFTDKWMSEDKDKELFDLLSKMKNDYREDLNNLFFVNDSVYNHLIELVAKKANVDPEILKYNHIDNVVDLLNGKEVELNNHNRDYILYISHDELNYYYDKEIIKNIYEGFISENVGTSTDVFHGRSVAKKGVYRGEVIIIDLNYLEDLREQISKLEGDLGEKIMVSNHTTPELIDIMKSCKAIVTDMGGILSHAAITAREIDKPCVIGTKHATEVLKNGDEIEVDADNGVVKILK